MPCMLFHKWDYCKCRKCGALRDIDHKWSGCKCAVCGKENHIYVDCKCEKCGMLRDRYHKWTGCVCQVCGKQDHEYVACKCKKCEKNLSACFGNFDELRVINKECNNCSIKNMCIDIEKLRSSKDIDGIIKALRHDNSCILYGAAKALGEIGDRKAVMSLFGLVDDTYYSVREVALEALNKIGKASVEVLSTVLRSDNFTEREKVIKTLGHIKDESATKHLQELLKDRDFKVRKAASESLDKLGWQPNNDDEKVSYLIASDLVSKGKFSELTKYGSKAADCLIDLLKDDDSQARHAAAEVLGEIGDKKAISHLMNIIGQDGNPSVRRTAIGALIKIGDIESLVSLLSTDDSDLRPLIINGLLELDYRPSSVEEQIDFFLVAKRWDDIAKIGKPAVKPLIAILNNATWDDRITAANALGELKDEEAIKPLIDVLDVNHLPVQNAAISALVNIGDPSISTLISVLRGKNSHVKQLIVKALGEINKPGVIDPLIVALQDESAIVRMAAVEALSKLQDFKIVTPLVSVALEDKDSNVRKVAIDSVIRLKSMVMASMESDSRIAEPASIALRKIDEIIKSEEQRRLEEQKRAEEKQERYEEQKRRFAEKRWAEEKRERRIQRLFDNILKEENIDKRAALTIKALTEIRDKIFKAIGSIEDSPIQSATSILRILAGPTISLEAPMSDQETISVVLALIANKYLFEEDSASLYIADSSRVYKIIKLGKFWTDLCGLKLENMDSTDIYRLKEKIFSKDTIMVGSFQRIEHLLKLKGDSPVNRYLKLRDNLKIVEKVSLIPIDALRDINEIGGRTTFINIL